MKKMVLAIACCALMGCKKEVRPESKIAPAPVPEKPVSAKSCYQAVLKKDTISLLLEMAGDSVHGRLTYNFFEKDKSDGTVTGYWKGDTLRARYIFVAEGQTSEQEVAFLKRGENLVEGSGEMKDDGKGNLKFAKPAQLNFTKNALVLAPTACKDDK